MDETSTSEIDPSHVRQKMRYADSELESAVENGSDEQAQYWLGQKRAFREVLNRCIAGTKADGAEVSDE